MNEFFRKYLFPSTLAAASLIGLIGVLLLYYSMTNIEQEQYSALPVDTTQGTEPETTQPTADVLSVDTSAGQVRFVDPATTGVAEQLDETTFNLGSLSDMSTRHFNVIFNTTNNSFAVALLKEPLAESRVLAENFLLSRLSISREELCALDVFVSTTYTINPYYAGVDVGFATCDGSLPLE